MSDWVHTRDIARQANETTEDIMINITVTITAADTTPSFEESYATQAEADQVVEDLLLAEYEAGSTVERLSEKVWALTSVDGVVESLTVTN